LAESGKLPPIDVFVDSPLAVNLTEVFRLHPECFNRQALDAMAREPDHDLLRFARLRYVRSVEESKSLNEPQEPAIIISASGMCEGGRILHHLKNNIGKPGATVLFVGFQGRHTLGRRLLDGVSPVRIFGDEHTVKAQIRQVHAYSAHADRQGLLDWAGAVQSKGKLKRVFLVHGEEEAAFALADVLKEQKILSVDVPEAGHMEKL
jgi:metallo-beta-lactamase family protein